MSNERELLMIPGPTMVSPRVLRALSKPILSHASGEFVEGFAEALRLQKKLFMTEGTPFMLAGSGTLGMEAAASNLVEKGDRVLCVENGFFGEKWAEIVPAHGGEAESSHIRLGEWRRPEAHQREAELRQVQGYHGRTRRHLYRHS